MDKISWADRVGNEEVLLTVREERSILHRIKIRKYNWIGHILRSNRLLIPDIEGKIEGRIDETRRQGRRYKQLLHDLKEKGGYWKLEKRSTRSHCLDNSIWKRLWTGNVTNEWMDG
jgi:hypothetical protein